MNAAFGDFVSTHLVSNIDYLCAGCDAQDYAFHGGDVVVGKPEIGG